MIAINETFGADPDFVLGEQAARETVDAMIGAAMSGATEREVYEVMAGMVIKKFVEIAVDKLAVQIADEIARQDRLN